MAERALITAVLLMVVISLCLYVTENFIPIGKNLDFRDVCRSYLMRMEYKSGLSTGDREALKSRLEAIGFEDVEVAAPASAKAGTVMNLEVSAVFRYETLAGIFVRGERSYGMSYKRAAVARKVINR